MRKCHHCLSATIQRSEMVFGTLENGNLTEYIWLIIRMMSIGVEIWNGKLTANCRNFNRQVNWLASTEIQYILIIYLNRYCECETAYQVLCCSGDPKTYGHQLA